MVAILSTKRHATIADADAVFGFWQNDTANSHLIITPGEIALIDSAVDSYWAKRIA